MTLLDAILFDIDDTLFSTREFARRARANAVQAMIDMGLQRRADEVLRELDEVIAEFSSNYGQHFDKLLIRLGSDCIGSVNPALVVAAGVAAYHDTKFIDLHPYVDVRPLLLDLKKSGARLGVVTHGWTTKQTEKLVRLELVRYFEPHSIFISEQIGISKPNPKLYLTALRQMGLEAAPDRVMYVGDNPPHDIDPPRSLGMRTTWARRGAKPQYRGLEVEADHVVDDFDSLRTILREQYGLPLPEAFW